MTESKTLEPSPPESTTPLSPAAPPPAAEPVRGALELEADAPPASSLAGTAPQAADSAGGDTGGTGAESGPSPQLSAPRAAATAETAAPSSLPPSVPSSLRRPIANRLLRHGNACLCCFLLLLVFLGALAEVLGVPVQPSSERMKAMVAQLGDANPKAQEGARIELKAVGPLAVTELRAAANARGAGPDVAARCRKLIEEINAANDPQKPPSGPRLKLALRLALILCFLFCLPLAALLDWLTWLFAWPRRVAPVLVALLGGAACALVSIHDKIPPTDYWSDCLIWTAVAGAVFCCYWFPLVLQGGAMTPGKTQTAPA